MRVMSLLAVKLELICMGLHALASQPVPLELANLLRVARVVALDRDVEAHSVGFALGSGGDFHGTGREIEVNRLGGSLERYSFGDDHPGLVPCRKCFDIVGVDDHDFVLQGNPVSGIACWTGH